MARHRRRRRAYRDSLVAVPRTSQLLCVVIPCYNEEEIIEQFYETLKPILRAQRDLDHCIVFVDDGSQDRTLEKLQTVGARDPAVRVYSLSRNFGHQIALLAGVDAARGDAVLMMDADLQHPPALIPEMVRQWRAGHDVVSAVRRNTDDVSLGKRLASRLFYWLINRLSDTPIVNGAADFCLLSRRAHRALRRMPESHIFLRGLVAWMGFPRAFVYFDAPRRPAGRSKYTALRRLELALTATFSFSIAPIRVTTRMGLLTILVSFAYLIYILVNLVLHRDLVPGWTSIIFVTLFLGGVQLTVVGILGEYVARIFEEVKRRPRYLFKLEPPPERGGPAERGQDRA
jgi:polyisoprenyl-phosphate glycosyltransferase